MAITWFKFDHHAFDRIEFRRFTTAEKFAWVLLQCLASKSPTRGIITADNEDIADYCEFASTQDWLYCRDKLIAKGLLEFNGSGHLQITGWEETQSVRPSDRPEAVKERVAKHRARKKAASQAAAPPPTLQPATAPSKPKPTPAKSRNAAVTSYIVTGNDGNAVCNDTDIDLDRDLEQDLDLDRDSDKDKDRIDPANRKPQTAETATEPFVCVDEPTPVTKANSFPVNPTQIDRPLPQLEKGSAAPAQVEVVMNSTTAAFQPRPRDAFADRVAAHSQAPGNPYPGLVLSGMAHLWEGPRPNDFWKPLVDRAVMHLKDIERPCETGDAKRYICNLISGEKWGQLATLEDEANEMLAGTLIPMHKADRRLLNTVDRVGEAIALYKQAQADTVAWTGDFTPC